MNSPSISDIPTSHSARSIQGNLSVLPSSNLGSRPSSSLSLQPSRPSSSASHRPRSVAAPRPISSASTRPQSRFSQRPNSRHARSRLVPQCQVLVSQVSGLKDEGTKGDPSGERFRDAVEHAVKDLEATTLSKPAASVDLSVIDQKISGHALKSRINSRDALGEALELSYAQVKSHLSQNHDLDQDIKLLHLPDHIQFLLQLSQIPSNQTVLHAEQCLQRIKNPPPPSPVLTWKEILAEEPFEGEHWEGVYGMANSNVCHRQQDQGDWSEWDSTPSLSPLNSDDLALDVDESVSSFDKDEPQGLPLSHEILETLSCNRSTYTFSHQKVVEKLKANQYWRQDWQCDTTPQPQFNFGDPLTLGPALENVLAQGKVGLAARILLRTEKTVHEEAMVREILMTLQGFKNIVLELQNGIYKTSPSTPRLNSLTLDAQASIISSFAHTATTVHCLRKFTKSIFSQTINARAQKLPNGTKNGSITRTCEAFADAVDCETRNFDAWCASREEGICRAYTGTSDNEVVVSLLETEKAVRDEFEIIFEALRSIVNTVFVEDEGSAEPVFRPAKRTPAAVTALLLDTLFSGVHDHLERGDSVTSTALLLVFVRCVEPVWGMIGKWLKNGMGTGVANKADELDLEFFIESKGVGIGTIGFDLLDPKFWKEAYALREDMIIDNDDVYVEDENRTKAIPLFLKHIAEPVLGAGKAVGLIRALGMPGTAEYDGKWRSFCSLVDSEAPVRKQIESQDGNLFSVSIDALSRLIYDTLMPSCQTSDALLAKVLADDCALWKHLNAIECLFLMRKGDVMSHFIDVAFAKMDAQQSWGDFHFLNTAFNDTLDANLNAGAREWVQSALVRLSFRGGNKDRDRLVKRTVRVIDGLVLEYAVPFPLTYIFRPRIMQVYGEIFVFLLQIKRAKHVLEKILVRSENGRDARLKSELKAFYAMRSRLSWFTNALLNFLTTYVIHAQLSDFHREFEIAKSLDEMIHLHDEHLDRIHGRCLLKTNTSALHRAILSILDISLQFSDVFVTFAGNTTATHDVSRQSIIMKRHRSRRLRRQRHNVIGFSQSFNISESSSDDEDEDEVTLGSVEGPGQSTSGSVMFGSSMFEADDDLSERVGKMSSELDSLVRFVRRGVESLAGGAGEAAGTFGVLAFVLEDWDM